MKNSFPPKVCHLSGKANWVASILFCLLSWAFKLFISEANLTCLSYKPISIIYISVLKCF